MSLPQTFRFTQQLLGVVLLVQFNVIQPRAYHHSKVYWLDHLKFLWLLAARIETLTSWLRFILFQREATCAGINLSQEDLQ